MKEAEDGAVRNSVSSRKSQVNATQSATDREYTPRASADDDLVIF